MGIIHFSIFGKDEPFNASGDRCVGLERSKKNTTGHLLRQIKKCKYPGQTVLFIVRNK